MGLPRKGYFRQMIATFFGCLGSVSLGFTYGWSAVAFPKIDRHETNFGLTIFDESWVISCVNIGSIIGTFPAGMLMDSIGRKKALLFLSSFSLVGWILIAFANSASILYLGRFLIGVWAGGLCAIMPNYLAEILEPSVRGSLGFMFAVMTNIGSLAIYVVGPLVTFTQLGLISSSITIAFFISFMFIPESPYYLIMTSQPKKARRNLIWFRGTKHVEEELSAIQFYIEMERTKTSSLSDLFLDEKYKRPFFSCTGLFLLQKGSGFMTILNTQSIILPERVGVLSRENCTLILGSILVVSVILAAFLVDKLGRKSLLQISNVGQSLSMILMGFWLSCDSEFSMDSGYGEYVPLAALLFTAVSFSTGLSPVPHIYLGETLPPSIKAKATALTITAAAVTMIVVNEIFATLTTYVDMYVNFFLFGMVSIAGLYYVNNYVIETKGKTLQMIQEEFERARTMRGDYIIL